MSLIMTIEGGKDICDWLEGMGRRASRSILLPIIKAGFAPVVAAERANIHSISGTLAMSLTPTAGSGDYKGRISVFSIPRASTKKVAASWLRSPKAQHRQFGARAAVSKRKRYVVFYGGWVNSGHRIVRRNKEGKLYWLGKSTKPVHYAARAMAAVGDSAAEATEVAILDEILGK